MLKAILFMNLMIQIGRQPIKENDVSYESRKRIKTMISLRNHSFFT